MPRNRARLTDDRRNAGGELVFAFWIQQGITDKRREFPVVVMELA